MGALWRILPKGWQRGEWGTKISDLFQICSTKDGALLRLGDYPSPSEETIEALKDDERFKEQCIFEVFDPFKNEFVHTFEGDFIDAFKWIAQNQIRIWWEASETGYKPDTEEAKSWKRWRGNGSEKT
jgi:hypothetical protein